MYEQSKENYLIENFAIAKIPLPSRCPKDYPYVAYDGKMCYTDKKYAEKKSGPCESWCTNDPTFGYGCGDPSLKLCKSKVVDRPAEPLKIPPITDKEAKCYLKRYPDLQNAFGNDIQKAKDHWKEYGFREKRNKNCDIQVVGGPVEAPRIIANPRKIPPITDKEAKCYLKRYPDLQKAFGNDIQKAKDHWKKYGFGEKRNKNCDIQVVGRPVEAPRIIANPRKTMLEDEFDDDILEDNDDGLSITIIVLIAVVILLLLLFLGYFLI